MAKLEDFLSLENLNRLRQTGEMSDIDRVAQKYASGEALSSSEIDLLNKKPERIEQALKNKPFTPSSNFEKIVQRLEPSMRMSSETPNISSKLKNVESSVLSDRAKQFSSSAGMAEDIDAAIEAEALKGKVNTGKLKNTESSILSDRAKQFSSNAGMAEDIDAENLRSASSAKTAPKMSATSSSKLQNLINKINEAETNLFGKLASNKMVSKGLPLVGAVAEGSDIAPSLREGRYLDALGNVLGTGSSLSALTGIGVPAAAIMAGGSMAAHGLSSLNKNSDLPQAFEELKARGTHLVPFQSKTGVSPYQLAKGGEELTPTKEQVMAIKENEEFNKRVNSAVPLTKKEFDELQGFNSLNLIPGQSNSTPIKDNLNSILNSIPKPIEDESPDIEETTDDEKKDVSDVSPENQAMLDSMALDKQQSESTVDALRQAQEEAKKDRAMSRLMMGAKELLRGALGTHYKVAMPESSNKFWEDRLKESDQPVKDLLTRVEQEKEDPNSPISKRMREIAGPMLGKLNITLPENTTYAELQKNFPLYTKMISDQVEQKERQEEKRENREFKKEQREEIQGVRISNQVNNRYDRNTKDEINRLTSAKKVEDLIDKIKSGVLVDSENIRNTLTNDISALALPTGVRATVADRSKTAINNLYTKMKDLESFVKSNPTKTIPKSYIDQFEKETKILKDAYAEALVTKTRSLNAGEPSEIGKSIIDDRTSSLLAEYGYAPDEISAKKTEYPKKLTRIIDNKKQTVTVENKEDEADAKKDGFK